MIPSAIKPNRAPGGVVMCLYAGDELVLEQPMRAVDNFDAEVARMAAEYSGDQAAKHLDRGATVLLVVYDGDDGAVIAGTIVTRV